MSIMPPDPDGNLTARGLVHDAAIAAVQIACDHHRDSERTRRYFLRRALSHGVSLGELCEIAAVDRATILELTDPAAG